MNKYKAIEKIAPKLTEMMIDKIKNLQTGYKKPWVVGMKGGDLPRNIRGNAYSGMNLLILLIHCEQKQFKSRVFLTAKQAFDLGLTVPKNATFPVLYYFKYVFDPVTHKSIKYEDYCKLSDDAKKSYRVLPQLRYYNVYNIDQTDCAEKLPEKYKELICVKELENLSDGFSNPALDSLIEHEDWYCPIKTQYSDKAFYSPGTDCITIPQKRQFPIGAEFYSTLLHEIAHSTGHAERLKRNLFNFFGTPAYAREELVAELTAALSGIFLGVSATLQDHNAAYLKSWLGGLKQQPEYLFQTLEDVTKAAKMITARVAQQPAGQADAA